MKTYKTFDDLEFKPWLEGKECPPIPQYRDAKQAIMEFPNGYKVSVLFGNMFYSDGIGSYELAVFHGQKLVYPKEVCPDDDVLGYLSKTEVSEAMRKVQDL